MRVVVDAQKVHWTQRRATTHVGLADVRQKPPPTRNDLIHALAVR